jgi:hypothetical protein
MLQANVRPVSSALKPSYTGYRLPDYKILIMECKFHIAVFWVKITRVIVKGRLLTFPRNILSLSSTPKLKQLWSTKHHLSDHTVRIMGFKFFSFWLKIKCNSLCGYRCFRLSYCMNLLPWRRVHMVLRTVAKHLPGGAGAGFLRVLWFPLPIFIPPISPQSPSPIIRG